MILCAILASILLLPLIIDNSFAIPVKTLAGETSAGKCNDKPPTSAVLRPHYANVITNKPITFAAGQVVDTHVSNEDFYFDHYSHDNIFLVLLNDQFSNLNSPSNAKDKNGKLLMEMEWEIGFHNTGRADRFPMAFWPFGGDLVSMAGRYIFDCGHPEHGPRSEIHPPAGVAFTRFEPMIFRSAGTDPLLASQTSIFINGAGGVFSPDINRLKNPDTNLLGFFTKKLLNDQQEIDAAAIKEYQLRASGGDTNTDVRIVHAFSIPLPPKPSPSSKLVTQITDLPFGGVTPKITGPLETADGKPFIQVSIDLRNAANCVPCVTYGTHIAACMGRSTST